MAKITLIEIQKRNKARVNVYIDDDYAFSLNLADAVKLKKGQVLTADDIRQLKVDDEVAKALDMSARFLSYRPRSGHEVRQYLAEKAVDEAVRDIVLLRLEAQGYVDDVSFARWWVENRTQFKPLGKTALRYELRQKGIADAVIGDVLESLDGESSALQAAEKQLNRLRGLDKQTFKAKLGSFLQRRGFDYATIQATIQHLFETLDSDFWRDTDDDS